MEIFISYFLGLVIAVFVFVFAVFCTDPQITLAISHGAEHLQYTVISYSILILTVIKLVITLPTAVYSANTLINFITGKNYLKHLINFLTLLSLLLLSESFCRFLESI